MSVSPYRRSENWWQEWLQGIRGLAILGTGCWMVKLILRLMHHDHPVGLRLLVWSSPSSMQYSEQTHDKVGWYQETIIPLHCERLRVNSNHYSRLPRPLYALLTTRGTNYDTDGRGKTLVGRILNIALLFGWAWEGEGGRYAEDGNKDGGRESHIIGNSKW